MTADKRWDDYEGEYYWVHKKSRHYTGINQFKSGFFSRIIMDECHGIANGERCRKLALFCQIKGIEKKWAVTGTPINKDGMYFFFLHPFISDIL